MALLYEGVDSLGALVAEIDERGAPHLEVAGLAARLRAASQREVVRPRALPAESRRPRFLPPRCPWRPQIPVRRTNAAADPGADLVAARGGIFSLEPEQLATVCDFVSSGLVPYACQLRVSKDSAALCARNFIMLGRLAKMGMVLVSSPTIEEVRAGVGRELVEALAADRAIGGPTPGPAPGDSPNSRNCSCGACTSAAGSVARAPARRASAGRHCSPRARRRSIGPRARPRGLRTATRRRRRRRCAWTPGCSTT